MFKHMDFVSELQVLVVIIFPGHQIFEVPARFASFPEYL
jgi:hypothetical protein